MVKGAKWAEGESEGLGKQRRLFYAGGGCKDGGTVSQNGKETNRR